MRVPAATLAAALTALKPAVPTRSKLPILHTVLLHYAGGILTLGATNLDSYLSTSIEAGGPDEWTLALPYKELAAGINPKGGDVELVPHPDHPRHTLITQDGGSYELAGQDPEDHPMLTHEWAHGESLTYLGERLPDLRDGVLPCAATDDSRPVLAGIHLKAEGQQLLAEAADGFRMARKLTHLHAEAELDVIVPARTFGPILKLAHNLTLYQPAPTPGADPVYLPLVYETSKYKQEIRVRAQLRTIDGQFPDLGQILPVDLPIRATIQTDVLEQAAKLKPLNDVIKFTGDGITVQHEHGTRTWNGTSLVYDGDPEPFALNLRYLRDAAKAMSSDGTVTVQLRNGNQAMKIEQGTLTTVIMPMVAGGA